MLMVLSVPVHLRNNDVFKFPMFYLPYIFCAVPSHLLNTGQWRDSVTLGVQRVFFQKTLFCLGIVTNADHADCVLIWIMGSRTFAFPCCHRCCYRCGFKRLGVCVELAEMCIFQLVPVYVPLAIHYARARNHLVPFKTC